MLMTDNWQPTILHLMPFSTNSVSIHEEDLCQNGDVKYINRGFPRLAVTRLQTIHDHNKPQHKVIRSLSGYAARSKDSSVRSKSHSGSRENSEYNSTIKVTSIKEVNYSVNDLNDQIIHPSKSYSPSPKNNEYLVNRSWMSFSSADIYEPGRCLPKSNVSRSVDGRHFMPQNGLWRAITMTPGEIDLRRQRVDRSSQKKQAKRHKVNIISLPRSTTPINDYDPDKLNMKNVIAFLQKNKADRKGDGGSPDSPDPHEQTECISTKDTNVSTKQRQEIYVQESHCSIAERKSRHRERPMEERFKKSGRTQKSADKKDYAVRPFRLHRFLTMATQATEPTETVCHKTYPATDLDLDIDHINYLSKPHMKSTASRINKEARAVNVGFNSVTGLHKHISLNKTVTKPVNNGEASRESKSKINVDAIRLPNMYDTASTSDDEEVPPPDYQNNCMVSSAFANAAQLSEIANKDASEIKSQLRKVQISVPDQTISLGTGEQVKLSLRKEKTLTREKTYMSDIGDSRETVDRRESILSSVCSLRQEFVDFDYCD